jgi:prepilin-type N-terminal cleavage/methylation domain-containing protein
MSIQHRQRGFTLLELMIGVTIMSLILYTTAQSLRTGSQVSQSTLDSALLAADGGRILHDIALELRSADKDYLYETVQASGSTDKIVRFAFSPCTGFDLTTGAPIYGTEAKQMLEYDSSTGTLIKYLMQDFTGGTAGSANFEGILLADNVAPDGFSVQQINTINTGTVYGNRIRINLSLIRNEGRADEFTSESSRIVFLRSFLFNSDGLGSNDGASSEPTTDPGPVNHPSKDPNPEEIPADTASTSSLPVVSWGQDTSTATEVWTDTSVSPEKTHEIDKVLIRVTVRGSEVSYQQGNKTKIGNLLLSSQSITTNFPYHIESHYTVTIKYKGNGGNETIADPGTNVDAETFYVDIAGPKVGSLPITLTAKSPAQTFKGTAYTEGSISTTHIY